MHIHRFIKNPLKRRRVKRGLSQKDIAKKLGLTQSQYSRIENGESDPTKYLNELSRILNCQPNELFEAKILEEIEEEFLNLPSAGEVGFVVHEKKPDYVFLKLEGWFRINVIQDTVNNINQINAHNKNQIERIRGVKPRIRYRRSNDSKTLK